MLIYSIGHSTRTFEEFIDILKHFKIELLIDVRQFPGSKKFPHFNKEILEIELPKTNIQYIHFPELGGFRKEGYLAFSQTKEFSEAIKKLLEIVDERTAVIMCAEKFFWRCHRKYVSSALVNFGNQIVHILDREKIYEHKLSEDLKQKMNLKIFCDKKAKFV
jgi:uncharacterized protein (DUF488 family)